MNIKQIIREEVNDFDWTADIPSDIIWDGMRFKIKAHDSTIYTVKFLNTTTHVKIEWYDEYDRSTIWKKRFISDKINSGRWIILDDTP